MCFGNDCKYTNITAMYSIGYYDIPCLAISVRISASTK
jgi:hypothetical protein